MATCTAARHYIFKGVHSNQTANHSLCTNTVASSIPAWGGCWLRPAWGKVPRGMQPRRPDPFLPSFLGGTRLSNNMAHRFYDRDMRPKNFSRRNQNREKIWSSTFDAKDLSGIISNAIYERPGFVEYIGEANLGTFDIQNVVRAIMTDNPTSLFQLLKPGSYKLAAISTTEVISNYEVMRAIADNILKMQLSDIMNASGSSFLRAELRLRVDTAMWQAFQLKAAKFKRALEAEKRRLDSREPSSDDLENFLRSFKKRKHQ